MTKELVDKITMLDFKQELKEHLNNVTEVLNEAKEEIIRLTKENVELNDKLDNLASVAAVRLANWQKYEKENAYAKTIIQDLLNNSDEYARQRAIDYLKGE